MNLPSRREIKNIITDLFENMNFKVSATFGQEERIGADLILEMTKNSGNKIFFVVEIKRRATIPSLSSAVEQVIKYSEKMGSEQYHPLIVVPYMGGVGAEFCSSNDISWLDLSGNAHIEAGNMYIHIEGKENQYKSPGRPSNVFAPKSSRVARYLLMHPNESIRQKVLVGETGLTRGYVSKIVKRLMEKDLIQKQDLYIKVRDPDVMLEAWREKYDFEDHKIIRGVIPAKSSQKMIRKLAKQFEAQSIYYAATGLGAAWLYTEYADFRVASFYLKDEPDEELLDTITFKKVKKGHNIWLIVPKDEGVFHGSKHKHDVRCVHPVQLYLDLIKGHPERAKDAAKSIRNNCINWEEF